MINYCSNNDLNELDLISFFNGSWVIVFKLYSNNFEF